MHRSARVMRGEGTSELGKLREHSLTFNFQVPTLEQSCSRKERPLHFAEKAPHELAVGIKGDNRDRLPISDQIPC